MLVDVCMPDLDGFQLAAMIREHPRFQKTAMIFISAIHLTDMDRLRGYEMGAVDYVPVPVIPEVLRAKVKVFAELYRKTRQLERMNAELEGARLRAHRGAGSIDRAAAAKRRAPQPRAGRRQHGLLGLESGDRRLPVGRRAVPHLRRRPKPFRRHGRERARAGSSRRLEPVAGCRAAAAEGPPAHADRVPGEAPERRDALVHRQRRAEPRCRRQGRCGSAA